MSIYLYIFDFVCNIIRPLRALRKYVGLISYHLQIVIYPRAEVELVVLSYLHIHVNIYKCDLI
jgi:hypothetical protein